MKRAIFTFACLFLLCIISINEVRAAGSACSLTTNFDAPGADVYTWAWTSDDTTGAVTCGAISVNGYIVLVETDPGTPAPTPYLAKLNNSRGGDIMTGLLAARSATEWEPGMAQINSLNVPFKIIGTLQPVITGAGNSKQGEIIVTIQTR